MTGVASTAECEVMIVAGVRSCLPPLTCFLLLVDRPFSLSPRTLPVKNLSFPRS